MTNGLLQTGWPACCLCSRSAAPGFPLRYATHGLRRASDDALGVTAHAVRLPAKIVIIFGKIGVLRVAFELKFF